MKLNSYQKILLLWGVVILIGYLLSIVVFTQPILFFSMWFVLGLAGLIAQFKLAGFGAKSTKWIQGLWIVVVLGGIFLNIFEYLGLIPLFGGSPFIGWPLAMVFAYAVIAVMYKLNYSYMLLAVLYLAFAGVVFMISNFTFGLVVSGILFALLCGIDAAMEGSALRKKSILKYKP